jgi:Flp pilus assembly protein CpaB
MTVTADVRPASGNGSTREPSSASVLRRRERNVPLGVLGVLLVLGSILGGLLWTHASVARTEVLVAAHDIPAGRRISDADLRAARLSSDGGVALIPAGQRGSVLGEIAAVPIPAGALLAPSEFGQSANLADDEAVVGVVLGPGATPTSDLRPGDRVAVVAAEKDAPATANEPSAASVLATATVFSLDRAASNDGVAVSLRVPASAATRVAAAAANGSVRLVLLPPGGSLPTTGPGS